MPVRNYTTSIKADKTIGEIEKILLEFGANSIYKEYVGSKVSSIVFSIEVDEQKVMFKMPFYLDRCRCIIEDAVAEKKLLQRFLKEPLRFDQGERVAWRVIKDLIHSQLSMFKIKYAEPLQLLLADAYNPVTNQTMFELVDGNKKKFLALSEG